MPPKPGSGANQHTVGLSRGRPHLEGESSLPVRSDDPKSPPWKHSAFRELERTVPPEELYGSLAASSDPRCQTLMALMSDVRFREDSLPVLARRAALSYAEVLRIITSHRLGQGLLAMSTHVPAVLEDAGIDAKAKLVPCRQCQGSGKLAAETIKAEDGEITVGVEAACWVCEGAGKLRKPGDTDARKIVFETMGLTGKGSAVNVNVATTVQMPSVEDDMTAAQKIIDMPAEAAGPAAGPDARSDAAEPSR